MNLVVIKKSRIFRDFRGSDKHIVCLSLIEESEVTGFALIFLLSSFSLLYNNSFHIAFPGFYQINS